MKKALLIAIAGVVLSSGTAFADSGGIEISQAWARATLPLTLNFAHAGAQQVTVTVDKVGAMLAGDMSAPGGQSMPGMSNMSSMPGMAH